MKVLRLVPLVLILAACSSVKVPSLSPYRIDVQQGNALEQESVDKLKPGLTRSQVRFLLGTPLVVDPFHANRWDYVYNFRKGGKLTEERRLVLFFNGDVLARIEAEGFPPRGDVPEAQPAAASEKPAEPARAAAAEPAPAAAPPVETARLVEPAPVTAVAEPAPAVAQAPETAQPAQPAPAAVAAGKPSAPAPQPKAEPAPAAVQPVPAQTSSSAERSLDETSIVSPLGSAQAKAPRKPAAVSETPPDSVALQPEDNAAALKPFVMPEFPNASSASSSPEEQIAAALNAWASAWRARDEDAYFSAYAANFRPEGGQSRAEWEKRRRLLLGVSRNIDIKIEGVATEIVSENKAIVSFKQLYRSDTYQDAVIKQMKFVRVDNLWLIEEEQVLAPIRVKK